MAQRQILLVRRVEDRRFGANTTHNPVVFARQGLGKSNGSPFVVINDVETHEPQ
jgi:hypothetical protein